MMAPEQTEYYLGDYLQKAVVVVGWGGGEGARGHCLISVEPLCVGDVITQHH